LDVGNSQYEASEISYVLDPNAPEAIYRMKRLKRLVQLSSSSIYRLEALGLFPKRVKLSASASGWRSSDIHAWIASRPFANPKKGAK
jgi:prophage regulatory protein